MLRRLLTLLCVISLAACASGGNAAPNGGGLVPSAAKPPSSATSRAKAKGKATLRITIPHRHRKHHARYVSVSTKAMTLAIAGPTTIPSKVFGLTPASGGCTAGSTGTTCTITVQGLAACPSSTNCYSATIVTYDAYDASNNTIPGSANELSAAQSVPFSVATGKLNTIPITLGGIAASVVLVGGAGSTLSGSMASGFTISKCGTNEVKVLGVDADGNDILGAGAPTVALSSTNSAVLAVASSQSGFTLTHPISQTVQGPVTLTATVTPAADSGGSQQSAPASVTITGGLQICGVVTEYAIPTDYGSFPEVIAAGPDGNLYFTAESGTGYVGQITPTGTIAENDNFGLGNNPFGITTGPDNFIWATTIRPAGRAVYTFPPFHFPSTTRYTTGLNGTPFLIVSGSDGNLWFTESVYDHIGQITTGGSIAEFPVTTGNAMPYGIAAGPDSNLWFTENQGNNIASITTGGTVTEYAIPTLASAPRGIVAAGDGNLWFTEYGANKIGRSTTAGVITEFSTGLTQGSEPDLIALGPDGSLYFTQPGSNQIGEITTAGVVTEFAIPTSASSPSGIVAGPNDTIWFTEAAANKIAEMQ